MLGSGDAVPKHITVQEDVVRGKKLDHSIKIVYRDTSPTHRSMYNKSIIAATDGKRYHFRGGNVMAVRYEGLGT